MTDTLERQEPTPKELDIRPGILFLARFAKRADGPVEPGRFYRNGYFRVRQDGQPRNQRLNQQAQPVHVALEAFLAVEPQRERTAAVRTAARTFLAMPGDEAATERLATLAGGIITPDTLAWQALSSLQEFLRDEQGLIYEDLGERAEEAGRLAVAQAVEAMSA